MTLHRADDQPTVYLEFGPTAVVENARNPHPISEPDYTKLFIARRDVAGDGIDRIIQADVRLEDVLDGLDAEDTRLRDAILTIISL